MAEVKSTKKDQPMLDPIAYRSDYSEDNIIGPEGTTVELTQKYTGEGTDNVYHPYNSTMTIDQLDPNYQYGQPAKDINRIDDSYLSRRNDQIASALYNEGRTTKEDVIAFLQGQNNWFNSTPEDRATTTENIYNRIGQLSQNQNQQDNTQYNTNEMRGELNKDTTGTIYGKTTADEGKATKGIQTLSDANSIDQIMNNARIANVEALIAMDDNAIAASIVSGTVPYGEQALTDLQKRMPDKYLNIQAKVKEIKTQNTVNAIASGKYEDINSTADVSDVYSQATSYAVNNASGSISATQLLKTIDAKLIESTSAQSAKELMMTIKENEAVLKNRLRNLNKEANTVFKGDVPDYIAKAYVNNKSQEIQNQLSILADRYSSAYDIYKTELAHAEWQSEYELKRDTAGLDDYKNNNISQGGNTNKNYMRTEKNNNPTAMTVGFMQWAGAELGVDYEVGDSFTSTDKNGVVHTYYTAKLIGDPLDTTIRIIDKAIAAGKNPFNTTSWGYINQLGINTAKWNAMSDEERKKFIIDKWLPREGGNIDNMAYYVAQNSSDETTAYNEDDATYYQKFLDADYTAKSRPETVAKNLGYGSVANFRNAALAWKEAEKKRVEQEVATKAAYWTRKDGEKFSLADTPTYDSLTYDQKNIVQQLLNLNKNPATVTKRQYGDDFERILSAIKEINPSWSDAQYGDADKARREWNTSSKNGSNSRNGTAIATAMDIYNFADSYGNVKWKDWNDMLNKLKDKLSDEAYTELSVNLETLASEYAGALKGNNAAPTEQEIEAKKQILAKNLGSGAMKKAAIQIARTLYNKNVNEAYSYNQITLEKAPLVVTPDVADWMYDVAGLTDMPNYYLYTPKSKGGNAPSMDYTDSSSIKDAIANNKK